MRYIYQYHAGLLHHPTASMSVTVNLYKQIRPLPYHSKIQCIANHVHINWDVFNMTNCPLTIAGLADTSVWKGIKSKFLHMALNVADTALQQYTFTIYFILPRFSQMRCGNLNGAKGYQNSTAIDSKSVNLELKCFSEKWFKTFCLSPENILIAHQRVCVHID